MTKNGFEIVEHTADVAIRVEGADVEELFANAARGMFSIIANLDTVSPRDRITVEVSGASYEDLMVNWLNELLYVFDAKRFLCCEFNIESVETGHLKARIGGEPLNLDVHELNTEVKAATYYELKVEPVAADTAGKAGSPWEAFVVFDI